MNATAHPTPRHAPPHVTLLAAGLVWVVFVQRCSASSPFRGVVHGAFVNGKKVHPIIDEANYDCDYFSYYFLGQQGVY